VAAGAGEIADYRIVIAFFAFVIAAPDQFGFTPKTIHHGIFTKSDMSGS